MFGVASIVLLEATLSFLAIGAAPSDASWGETLAQGALLWMRDPGAGTGAPADPTASALRLLIAPSVFLLVTIAGSYLVAEALRNAMEFKTARRPCPARD
ncbi:MAG: hypothetical protein R3B70_17720 [Polyangiaceae bacterium]